MSSRNPERPTPRRRVLARPPPVRSTSSPSEATTSTSAATEPTTGGSFLFSSLSGVWASLKAAAALEVGGFVKALNGGGAEGEAGVRPALGDKRGRTGEATEESSAGSQGSNARTKRRKIRTDDDSDLVFDGVPPLMPPIAHSSWFAKRTDAGTNKSASLSRVAATALRSSTSPISRRSSLRFSGTAATTYEDELMRSTLAGTDKGLSSALAAPRPSGERKHRRDASGSGPQPPQFSGSQSVRASSSFSGGGGRATMRKSVWRPWTVGQQLLAGAADDASLSSSASLLGGRTPNISLADELAACEGQESGLVSGQVSRGRQEEDRRVEQRRIDALEEEVRKLRNELSVQRAFNSPASAFAKAPRVSAAPPPPPPPPPPPRPVGGPHPMLLTARAKLRATPERPKRRHSTMMMGGGGGPVGVPLLAGLDMTTLMSEVGDQRHKLRKVGLPKERTQEELRRERAAGGSGFGDVLLQRSLKPRVHRPSGATWSVTSLTKTASLKPDSVSEASTITRTGTSVDGSSALTTPSTALTSSKSAPGEGTASQTSGGLGRGPSSGGPISSTSSGAEQSSKDADAIEDTDFAESDAKGIGEVEDGDGAHSHDNGAAAEMVSPDSPRPETDPEQRDDPRLRAVRVSITQPPSPASPRSPNVPERAMSSPIKQDNSAAAAVRRRRPPRPPCSRADKLPGLEFGRSRPLTPGRRQKKQQQQQYRVQATEQGQGPLDASLSQGSEQEEDPDRPPLSPRPNIASSPRSPQSPRPELTKPPRRGPRRVQLTQIEASNAQDAALEDQLVAEAEATLTGQGERAPDPNRVFGRA